MQVVGHQLLADDFNLGEVDGNGIEFHEDGMPQVAGMHLDRLIVAADLSQQGPSPLDSEGNHIDAAPLVIMPNPSPFH